MHRLKHFALPLLLLLAFAVLPAGCDLAGSGESESDFDRAAMLRNYGENLALPAFEALKTEADELQAAAAAFSGEQNASSLADLREELKHARLAWQHASLYSFGPAEMRLLRPSLNTYPVDTAQVEENIASGEYDLGAVGQRDAAGFPAMGYMLYGLEEDDAALLERYRAGNGGEEALQYLSDLANQIQSLAGATLADWQGSGGDYLGTFLSEERAGTDKGSSLGMMFNAYVLHFERFLRSGKIGIPSGVLSAGVPRPRATEAYYGGYSAELALANLRAVRRFFRGEDTEGIDGPGLRDNLQAAGADELASEIEAKMQEAENALQGVSDPLSAQIENDNEPVLDAFTRLQDVVSLVKADMASVLGVTITYQDNDGD
ncbi:MAG: imelysin family protein [Balneolaceae bacterium]|nr:imelysin family protein [Balneolaceae bacterium]